MSYIDLRGHEIWHQEWKPRKEEPLLLLHGGLSSTESFAPKILPSVKRTHHSYGYDRTAHGKTKVREGYYHFKFQRDEAIAYIEDVIKKPTHIIGNSDGGIIGLMVAIARPDLVKTLVAIGANYHYDCGLNHQMFGSEVEEEAKDRFAARTGQPRELLVEIIHKAHKVWASEPRMTKSQLKKIKCPTLVLAGDDEPFSTDHTVSLYESIPNAQLAIVPGTSHAVLKEKPRVVKQILQDFYRDPNFPITLNPNRRLKETLRIRGQA